VYCQACGVANPDDQEFCRRCHQKLLVVSGGRGDERDDLLAELVRDERVDTKMLRAYESALDALR